MKGIIGKKLGMTHFYGEEGKLISCTVIEAGPCVVVQKKTDDTDGYNAVQLGFEELKEVPTRLKPVTSKNQALNQCARLRSSATLTSIKM